MGKETTPKIGTIRFTDREKELIAIAVESDFFKLLEKKFVPQRVTKIAVTLLATGLDEKDMRFQQGRAYELEQMIKEIRGVADKYNKANLDADTESADD